MTDAHDLVTTANAHIRDMAAHMQQRYVSYIKDWVHEGGSCNSKPTISNCDEDAFFDHEDDFIRTSQFLDRNGLCGRVDMDAYGNILEETVTGRTLDQSALDDHDDDDEPGPCYYEGVYEVDDGCD